MRHKIKALFLDVGGVLLTNGWDRELRQEMAARFGLDFAEMNDRHSLVFDNFERGDITLDEYLEMVIFNVKRPFLKEEFVKTLLEHAKPFQDMIDYVKALKKEHHLKIVIVSNEGMELAQDRIQRFHLQTYVDVFIFSSFVRYRKPDPKIYELALNAMYIPPEEVCYIDDRLFLVEQGKKWGMHGIHHTSLAETKKALKALGL